MLAEQLYSDSDETNYEAYYHGVSAYTSNTGWMRYVQRVERWKALYQMLSELPTEPNYVLDDTFFVYPITKTAEGCKVVDVVTKKTKDDLFREAYNESYQSPNIVDISEVDVKGFIEYCEERYKMSTDKFLQWFSEEQDNEGNVEMRLWARYARNFRRQDGKG